MIFEGIGQKPSGRYNFRMDKRKKCIDALLEAAEQVVIEKGIANLTLDAVACQAGVSKGGLLYYFPNKNQLIQALVQRSADNWRACYTEAYESAPEGPGRMVRGLVGHCLSDGSAWTDELRSITSSVFAALAQDPELIKPMRLVYDELHVKIRADGLPTGIAETVLSAIDGLWLNWVLGFAPFNQENISNVRTALEQIVNQAILEGKVK